MSTRRRRVVILCHYCANVVCPDCRHFAAEFAETQQELLIEKDREIDNLKFELERERERVKRLEKRLEDLSPQHNSVF